MNPIPATQNWTSSWVANSDPYGIDFLTVSKTSQVAAEKGICLYSLPSVFGYKVAYQSSCPGMKVIQFDLQWGSDAPLWQIPFLTTSLITTAAVSVQRGYMTRLEEIRTSTPRHLQAHPFLPHKQNNNSRHLNIVLHLHVQTSHATQWFSHPFPFQRWSGSRMPLFGSWSLTSFHRYFMQQFSSN